MQVTLLLHYFAQNRTLFHLDIYGSLFHVHVCVYVCLCVQTLFKLLPPLTYMSVARYVYINVV